MREEQKTAEAVLIPYEQIVLPEGDDFNEHEIVEIADEISKGNRPDDPVLVKTRPDGKYEIADPDQISIVFAHMGFIEDGLDKVKCETIGPAYDYKQAACLIRILLEDGIGFDSLSASRITEAYESRCNGKPINLDQITQLLLIAGKNWRTLHANEMPGHNELITAISELKQRSDVPAGFFETMCKLKQHSDIEDPIDIGTLYQFARRQRAEARASISL